MASMVTIRDLQTPLGPDIKADMGETDFWDYLTEASMDQGYDYVDRISLVREKINQLDGVILTPLPKMRMMK